MEIVLQELALQERYKLLTALVIPRPIALVTTRNENGTHNAAPFSFFNVVSDEPPEPMAPPEPALEPVSLDPGAPEAVAMIVPDASEPVSLAPALDAPAPVPSFDGSCDACDGSWDGLDGPPDPPVSPAFIVIPCFSGHMAPVCSDDCDPVVLQAIPSTSGIADATFDMDMEVLLDARSCVLPGRAAIPAAEGRQAGERLRR
jgi:hypothetical protein